MSMFLLVGRRICGRRSVCLLPSTSSVISGWPAASVSRCCVFRLVLAGQSGGRSVAMTLSSCCQCCRSAATCACWTAARAKCPRKTRIALLTSQPLTVAWPWWLPGPLFNFLFAIAAYWVMFVLGVPGAAPDSRGRERRFAGRLCGPAERRPDRRGGRQGNTNLAGCFDGGSR